MILAQFGNESFYVNSEKGIYTIGDVSFEYGKEVESQGTTGNKPITYITALKLISSGFKIHLDHRFVDVKEKIDIWREMAENNKLYSFSIGGVFVSSNKFGVLSAKVSNLKVNGKGKWLSCDLDISVEENTDPNNQGYIGILKKRLEDYT